MGTSTEQSTPVYSSSQTHCSPLLGSVSSTVTHLPKPEQTVFFGSQLSSSGQSDPSRTLGHTGKSQNSPPNPNSHRHASVSASQSPLTHPPPHPSSAGVAEPPPPNSQSTLQPSPAEGVGAVVVGAGVVPGLFGLPGVPVPIAGAGVVPVDVAPVGNGVGANDVGPVAGGAVAGAETAGADVDGSRSTPHVATPRKHRCSGGHSSSEFPPGQGVSHLWDAWNHVVPQ
mmetsp:Transcript_21259/g.61882  ORF Transcript_21259/g.61882 Transcript_21259/m.61882 type:complete len:227 (+) Transcript_21259:1360-2040(+)